MEHGYDIANSLSNAVCLLHLKILSTTDLRLYQVMCKLSLAICLLPTCITNSVGETRDYCISPNVFAPFYLPKSLISLPFSPSFLVHDRTIDKKQDRWLLQFFQKSIVVHKPSQVSQFFVVREVKT